MNNLNDPINDPSKYKFGVFYFNPDDDRVIVPKRIGALGWTLNFANPKAYFAIFVIVLLIGILIKTGA